MGLGHLHSSLQKDYTPILDDKGVLFLCINDAAPCFFSSVNLYESAATIAARLERLALQARRALPLGQFLNCPLRPWSWR